MTISFNETTDFSETNISYDDVSTLGAVTNYSPKTEEFHLFGEKLRVPQLKDQLSRPRLSELLTKFSEQIGATLVTGRAGTGKTVLAADFARNYNQVAWYRVEAADSNWEIFARYFTESLKKCGFCKQNFRESAFRDEVPALLENIFIQKAKKADKNPTLIVIDDVHHIFDADWFADFFNSLLFLLTPNTHLLLLARTSPAFPLWRLRSKQVLGVIDEDLLLFNFEEAKKFFAQAKIPLSSGLGFYKQSYGRISKLIDLTSGVKKNVL